MIFFVLLLISHNSAWEYLCEDRTDLPDLVNFLEDKSKTASVNVEYIVNKCSTERILVVGTKRIVQKSERIEIMNGATVLKGDQIDAYYNREEICILPFNRTNDRKIDIIYAGMRSEIHAMLDVCGFNMMLCYNRMIYPSEMFNFKHYIPVCYFDLISENIDRQTWKLVGARTAFYHRNQLRILENTIACASVDVKESGAKMRVICTRSNCLLEKSMLDYDPLTIEEIQAACQNKIDEERARSVVTFRTSYATTVLFIDHLRVLFIIFFAFIVCLIIAKSLKPARGRMIVCESWDAFMKLFKIKDEEDNEFRAREKFIYERFKKERSKPIRVEHYLEELTQAKNEITQLGKTIKESIDRGYDKPSKYTVHEVSSLVEWSWILESSMFRSMEEKDTGAEISEFYKFSLDQES